MREPGFSIRFQRVPEMREIAATLNNLGVLLGERGDWTAAEPLIREALEMIRSVNVPTLRIDGMTVAGE